jgi:hypothetical protein
MKQFGLAALLAIGAALFTSRSAAAEDFGPITLGSTGDTRDQDYGATGQATLSNVTPGQPGSNYGYGFYYYWDGRCTSTSSVALVIPGDLTVSCQGLTPGATYQIKATAWYTDYYFLSKKGQPTANSYSYFQFPVSANGAGEVTVPVSYAEVWLHQFDDCWGGFDYWEQLSGGRLWFTVERKDGRNKYTTVLGGSWSNLP